MRSRLLPHVQPHEPFCAIEPALDQQTLTPNPQTSNPQPVLLQNERAETRQLTPYRAIRTPITSNDAKTAQSRVSNPTSGSQTTHRSPSNPTPKVNSPRRHTEAIRPPPSLNNPKPRGRVVGGQSSAGSIANTWAGGWLVGAGADSQPLGRPAFPTRPPRSTDSGISSHARRAAPTVAGRFSFFSPADPNLWGDFLPPIPAPRRWQR